MYLQQQQKLTNNTHLFSKRKEIMMANICAVINPMVARHQPTSSAPTYAWAYVYVDLKKLASCLPNEQCPPTAINKVTSTCCTLDRGTHA